MSQKLVSPQEFIHLMLFFFHILLLAGESWGSPGSLVCVCAGVGAAALVVLGGVGVGVGVGVGKLLLFLCRHCCCVVSCCVVNPQKKNTKKKHPNKLSLVKEEQVCSKRLKKSSAQGVISCERPY